MESPRKANAVERVSLRSGGLQVYPVPSGSAHTLTLAEQIADRIADMIISGRYSPGERVSEQELADIFEVSRGPIRDALRILEMEGLVRIMPRRGTVVAKLTTREIDDIFKVRACLLGLAAKLAAENRTPEDEAWLVSSISETRAAAVQAGVDEFLRLAYRISLLVVECSGNEKLRRIFLSMARQTLPVTREAWTRQQYRELWAANWATVANAILQGDSAGAETAAKTLVAEAGAWAVRVAEGH